MAAAVVCRVLGPGADACIVVCWAGFVDRVAHVAPSHHLCTSLGLRCAETCARRHSNCGARSPGLAPRHMWRLAARSSCRWLLRARGMACMEEVPRCSMSVSWPTARATAPMLARPRLPIVRFVRRKAHPTPAPPWLRPRQLLSSWCRCRARCCAQLARTKMGQMRGSTAPTWQRARLVTMYCCMGRQCNASRCGASV